MDYFSNSLNAKEMKERERHILEGVMVKDVHVCLFVFKMKDSGVFIC